MKVAVAGLGWWGKHIINVLSGSAKFEVIAAVDPMATPEATQFVRDAGLALASELGEVLRRDDVEGVILATPHSLHEAQVLAALEAGKQVFCEKPFAMTAAGARRMIDAANAKGRVLGIGHERRFELAMAEMMRLVSAGELGRVLHVETNISHDLFRHLAQDNWRLSPAQAPAGMMTAVGIHVTDVFIALCGPVESVRCMVDSMVFTPPAVDHMSATLRFRSGARGTISLLSATPFHGRIAIFGDKGWVELVSEGNVDKGLPTILTHCHATDEPRSRRSFEANDAVLMNFETWCDAVEGRGSYPFTPQQLLENIKLLEAIVLSAAQQGAEIRLDTLER